jgi:hypothetical protein
MSKVYTFTPLDTYIGPEIVSVPTQKQMDQWEVRSLFCTLLTTQQAEQTHLDDFIQASGLLEMPEVVFMGHLVAGDARVQLTLHTNLIIIRM